MYNVYMSRMYSFDKSLPDGRVVSVCLPRMSHLRANITYCCDRKCPNCNRACGVAPSSEKENMRPEQFQAALDSCNAIGRRLTKIILTGGEPSMHPQFGEFADIAMDYRAKFNPTCHVWIGTYHHPKHFHKIAEACAKHPDIQIQGNPKTKPREHRYATYMAPADDPTMPANHFYRGCHLNASLCGMTVDYKGFYCCPVAPAIARVFGLNLAVVDGKDVSVDSLTAQYDTACRLCGFYRMTKVRHVAEPMTKSWVKAVTAYKNQT